MYSIRYKGKSVVAERFIWNLKTKIYKYMSSFSKNVYIDKSDEIVNKYNNTYHRIIKMKPVDVKPSTYILTLTQEKVRKVLNLKLVIISKYHNIKKFFAKGYFLNWSEEVFCDWKSLKILLRGHMLLVILKEKKLLGCFSRKNYTKESKKNFG